MYFRSSLLKYRWSKKERKSVLETKEKKILWELIERDIFFYEFSEKLIKRYPLKYTFFPVGNICSPYVITNM